MENSKVVLMTGAGRGLGEVMTLALLKDGHRVVMSSTDAQSMKDVVAKSGAKPGQTKIIVAELDKSGEAERLAKEAEAAFGQIDILVNNAGMSVNSIRKDYMTKPFRFWESNRAQIERFFAVNTVAGMVLSNLLAPKMIARGWGRIVANTTSLDTMLRTSLYGGSKAALEAETAIMSTDLAGTGVTANVLVPGGGTGSRMTDELGIPRDKVFPPEIMGPPMSFLASTLSDQFTGKRIQARLWDTSLPPLKAAEVAGAPIAWTGYGILGVQPDMAQVKK